MIETQDEFKKLQTVIHWGAQMQVDDRNLLVYKATHRKKKLDQIVDMMNPAFFDQELKNVNEEKFRRIVNNKVSDELDPLEYFR